MCSINEKFCHHLLDLNDKQKVNVASQNMWSYCDMILHGVCIAHTRIPGEDEKYTNGHPNQVEYGCPK